MNNRKRLIKKEPYKLIMYHHRNFSWQLFTKREKEEMFEEYYWFKELLYRDELDRVLKTLESISVPSHNIKLPNNKAEARAIWYKLQPWVFANIATKLKYRKKIKRRR